MYTNPRCIGPCVIHVQPDGVQHHGAQDRAVGDWPLNLWANPKRMRRHGARRFSRGQRVSNAPEWPVKQADQASDQWALYQPPKPTSNHSLPDTTICHWQSVAGAPGTPFFSTAHLWESWRGRLQTRPRRLSIIRSTSRSEVGLSGWPARYALQPARLRVRAHTRRHDRRHDKTACPTSPCRRDTAQKDDVLGQFGFINHRRHLPQSTGATQAGSPQAHCRSSYEQKRTQTVHAKGVRWLWSKRWHMPSGWWGWPVFWQHLVFSVGNDATKAAAAVLRRISLSQLASVSLPSAQALS